jgi:hypothetical protein
MQGPNVKKLIAQKMAMDAVPKGGGLAEAIAFISSAESIKSGAAKATQWVNAAIQAVRDATEPNPWKNADDETIAEMLLKEIETKRLSHAGRR